MRDMFYMVRKNVNIYKKNSFIISFVHKTFD